MQHISCPLCGLDKSWLVTREGAFNIVECLTCNFVYVNPQPDSEYLRQHYQAYLPQDDAAVKDWAKMMDQIFAQSLDLIESFGLREGKLLDIGCAHGFFLEKAIQRGFVAEGIDLCQPAITQALKKGLNATCQELFAQKYPDNHFDLVTLFYVLEHLPDPQQYLAEIWRILKPNGLILIRVPHTTPLVKLLKFFRIVNKLYDAPSHLSDFSPQTLKAMLLKLNFSKIKTFIGGNTYPADRFKRLISISSGVLAQSLYQLSCGKYLLPGVSKTTLAVKAV